MISIIFLILAVRPSTVGIVVVEEWLALAVSS